MTVEAGWASHVTSLLKDVEYLERRVSATCPKCLEQGSLSMAPERDGRKIAQGLDIALGCFSEAKCAPVEILAAVGLTLEALRMPKAYANGHANGNGHHHPNGDSDTGQVVKRPLTLKEWEAQVFYFAEWTLRNDPEYRDKPVPAELLLEPLRADLKQGIALMSQRGSPPPDGLSESGANESIDHLSKLAIEAWANRPIWNGATKRSAMELIVCENAEQAIVSNAEYLSRLPIIDRLYYTQHISLGVGGKHEGKTTDVRTEALAVASGLPVYNRPTTQTPVIYAASDDEYPTTRMELLRMGWQERRIPLIMVRVQTAEGNASEPERVLAALARLAEKEGAHFIVLDMLFDFVRIADELKYAHTREAIGKIQILADEIKGHVRSTHHSPKWMPDAASAAKAALGSQGIAARFSPILLSKKWAEGLYTVESTATRDPRGEALPVLCVERGDDGWAQIKGPFASWMKWRMYSDRILGLFQGGEPGRRMSVSQMVEALEINRPEIQNACYQMCQGDQAVLQREGTKGRGGYKYFLKENDLFGGN